MSVLEDMRRPEAWRLFLEYKKQTNHISKAEAQKIENFIQQGRYRYYCGLMEQGAFPSTIPVKRTVNKEGTQKKRVVYSFAEEENIVLKFIAHELYRFDDIFSDGCYAFRRGYGVKDAMRHFRGNAAYSRQYCFKADISNYFNSIDEESLIDRLAFVREKDGQLYDVFVKLLRERRVYENGVLTEDKHGAMAGTPVSPFFANVYLTDMDNRFCSRGVRYFRYSDDILIFADTAAELDGYMDSFYDMAAAHGLAVNASKVTVTKPGEVWEFLGFSYNMGEIDLSANTMKKIKGKIKRKAEALRRWQRKKGLTADKAAKGFINAMNIKFFGTDRDMSDADGTDFTWSRWFFPNITTDKGLKAVDSYMQEYVRYVMTGRHYKGNFRITYEQLKSMGYRSLVHEYYGWRKDMAYDTERKEAAER